MGHLFDAFDRRFGFVLSSVHDEPPRTLREIAAHVDDREGQNRANQEAQSPRHAVGEVVEDVELGQRPEQCAAPVRAVDADVDASPILLRDHLVDRGVDRGVLTADTHTGDETRAVEKRHPASAVAERRGRQTRADQVHAERYEKELASPNLSESRPNTSAPTTSPIR